MPIDPHDPNSFRPRMTVDGPSFFKEAQKQHKSWMRRFAGCFTTLFVTNVLLGGVSFDYALGVTVGKDVPAWLDFIVGAVFGVVTVPAAIVCLVVDQCGVQTPFFPM